MVASATMASQARAVSLGRMEAQVVHPFLRTDQAAVQLRFSILGLMVVRTSVAVPVLQVVEAAVPAVHRPIVRRKMVRTVRLPMSEVMAVTAPQPQR